MIRSSRSIRSASSAWQRWVEPDRRSDDVPELGRMGRRDGHQGLARSAETPPDLPATAVCGSIRSPCSRWTFLIVCSTVLVIDPAGCEVVAGLLPEIVRQLQAIHRGRGLPASAGPARDRGRKARRDSARGSRGPGCPLPGRGWAPPPSTGEDSIIEQAGQVRCWRCWR